MLPLRLLHQAAGPRLERAADPPTTHAPGTDNVLGELGVRWRMLFATTCLQLVLYGGREGWGYGCGLGIAIETRPYRPLPGSKRAFKVRAEQITALQLVSRGGLICVEILQIVESLYAVPLP